MTRLAHSIPSLVAVSLLLLGSAPRAVTIDTVVVGKPGNAGELLGADLVRRVVDRTTESITFTIGKLSYPARELASRAPVPEPSTLTLLTIAIILAAVTGFRRRWWRASESGPHCERDASEERLRKLAPACDPARPRTVEQPRAQSVPKRNTLLAVRLFSLAMLFDLVSPRLAVAVMIRPTAAPSGQLLAWGDNSAMTHDVPAGDDFIAIDSKQFFIMAARSDGSLVGWGANDQGQTNVPVGTGFTAFATGTNHGLAIRSDGSLVGWGLNNLGQTNVPTGNNFIDVAGGVNHSLALRADGGIDAWGSNGQAQLEVPVHSDYFSMAAGSYHNLAIRNTGSCGGAPVEVLLLGAETIRTMNSMRQ